MEPAFGVLLKIHRGTPQYGEWVVACLDGAWANLVGERLAGACRPAKFQEGELVIEVLDRGWEKAVKSLKPELLEKLRSATACGVKTIVVVSRPQTADSKNG